MDQDAEASLRLGYCGRLISLVDAGGLTRAEFRLRDPFVTRAELHHAAGRDPEALADLERAARTRQFSDGVPVRRKMDSWPDYRVYLLRGEVQFELGQYEAALLSLREARGLTTVGKPARSRLKHEKSRIDALAGAAYLRLGRTSEALVAVNRAIATDRGAADAYRVRSEIYTSIGQVDAARADALRAADLSD